MLKITLLRYCLFSLLLAIPFASCTDNIQSSIPDYPVNLDLNLTSTYPNFRAPNQFIVYDKRINEIDRIGYGGIIIYSGLDLNYYAFDMACPYEAKRTILVHPDTTGLPQVICKTCGSIFDVSYGIGNPSSGPAKEVLKRYRTNKSGDLLYISN